MEIKKYIYLGDRFTLNKFKNKECQAITSDSGKCYRGRAGVMLLKFLSGERAIVLARRLRKLNM